MAQATPFRNEGGRHYTKGLFYETALGAPTAIYTLKDQDHVVDGKTYISLFKLYMELEDPTEYEFATTYLGGWSHWVLLSESTFMVERVARWRLELHLKLTSKALKVVRREASDKASRNQFQAVKMLIDRSWDAFNPKSKRGRPSNDEVAQELKERADEDQRLEADLSRLKGES